MHWMQAGSNWTGCSVKSERDLLMTTMTTHTLTEDERSTLRRALIAMNATDWHRRTIYQIWRCMGYEYAMQTIAGWKGEENACNGN